jgi:uncharacterized cupin superfamily protein
MPKIDLSAVPAKSGSGYPGGFADPVRGRSYQNLGDYAGLTQYGVRICRLAPGAWSSQRHWHENEDEFLMMLEGELVLVEDDGEHVMRPGDCAAWKAGAPNGHHLINRSAGQAAFLVVGTRSATEVAHYPDIDLRYVKDASGGRYLHKDGTPY